VGVSPSNNVKKLRLKKGLSQAALARKAQTSQQQIHRIEAGQAARVELAARICLALGETMDAVFPGAGRVIKRLHRDAKKTGLYRPRDHDIHEAANAGVDAGTMLWTLVLRLRGGAQLKYQIDSNTQRRVHLWIGGNHEPEEFFEFDTPTAEVAVNFDHVLYAHLLFDSPLTIFDEKDEDPMRVFLAGEPTPIELDPEPDEPGENNEDGPLYSVLFQLSLASGRASTEFITVTDIDGEVAFFRIADISLVEIPYSAVHPKEDIEEMPEPESEPTEAEDG
jgi:transcriptional regulator with XRE-family HTH domain